MVQELRQMAFAREALEGMESVVEYGSGQLSGMLVGLQRNKVSGIIRANAASPRGTFQRVLVCRDGAIVYAGNDLPTPREFVSELSRHLKIGVIDTVLQFAAKRSSVQSLLTTMVQIEVLQWPEIVTAMRKQASLVLEELLATEGTLAFEADLATFDLHYDGKEPGFAVDALLLEIELRHKKKSTSKESIAAPPVAKAAPEKGDDRPTILSVDDSSIAQALVRRALGQQYNVIGCTSALEALSVLDRQDDVSLLLLDLTMPDMDGLEFCRTVRKIEKFKGLPIVMITARDGMVDRLRGRIAGTSHYLTKPVKPAELAAVVAQYSIA